MEYTRRNQGTCSRQTTVVIEDGIVKDLRVLGGCNGNLKGIMSLVKGMKAEEVINRLQGIPCGNKGTSCPNQLSKALKQMTSGATN